MLLTLALVAIAIAVLTIIALWVALDTSQARVRALEVEQADLHAQLQQAVAARDLYASMATAPQQPLRNGSTPVAGKALHILQQIKDLEPQPLQTEPRQLEAA